jgi:hypothetical protein
MDEDEVKKVKLNKKAKRVSVENVWKCIKSKKSLL